MLDSETAERRQQLFGDLEKERDKLNAEVENLRSFEREYRSRLKSYFSQQLAALDGSGEGGVLAGDDHAPKRLQSLLGDESEQPGRLTRSQHAVTRATRPVPTRTPA